MKLAGQTAINLVAEKAGNVVQFVSVSRLLLASEKNDLQRLRLAQNDRKFQYEATLKCVKDLPPFRAHLEAIEQNPRLTNEEKYQRLDEILHRMKQKAREEASDDPVPTGEPS